MKKTKLMRAALLLLVLTLITSCFVGGTFAKYTTKGQMDDAAHVARWGVTVTANGGMFNHEYATKETDDAAIVGVNSVISSNNNQGVPKRYNTLAPGTSGGMGGVTITGEPEVAVEVNYTAYIDLSYFSKDGSAEGVYGNLYCPLIITVKNGENDTNPKTIDGKKYSDIESFRKAVKDAVESYSKKYPAGTDLSKEAANIIVTWEWPYTTGTKNDGYDTILGNKNADDGSHPSVTFTLTARVTQVD